MRCDMHRRTQAERYLSYRNISPPLLSFAVRKKQLLLLLKLVPLFVTWMLGAFARIRSTTRLIAKFYLSSHPLLQAAFERYGFIKESPLPITIISPDIKVQIEAHSSQHGCTEFNSNESKP